MKPHAYVDRATGEMRTERVHAERLLHWLYNTRAGNVAEAALTRTRHASRLYGWLQRRAGSRKRIRPFVERLGVDLTGVTRPLDEFATFHEFFTRTLHPWARPVDPDPAACVSPADGKVLAWPRVEADTAFRVKRSLFRLRTLLADDALADHLAGGSVVIVRLALADYHHVHFPCEGTPGASRRVGGAYHAGGPYAQRHLVPFFTENHRVITELHTERFGRMAMVEVGALTVGSIVSCAAPGRPVRRGDRKGWFEPGGSTVVLVFPAGAVELDADIVANTQRELETFVRMGERIGRATGDLR